MSKKPSICIISQYFLPDINGIIIRLVDALNALIASGFSITLITAVPHYPSGKIPLKYRRKTIFREHWNGINIIRVPVIPVPHQGFLKRLFLYSSFTFFSTCSLPLIKKVDIVWSFQPNVFSSIPGTLIKLFKRATLVTDMVDIWPHALVNSGYLKTKSRLFTLIGSLVHFVLRVSDHVLTLTEAMRSLVLSEWQTPENKLHILGNPIDTHLFMPMKTKKSKELEGKFVIMYSGNLGPSYDFETMLQCANELRYRDDILFLIRGDGEMKKVIKNYIKRHWLNNTILDDRIVGREKLVQYLNMADAYVLPMKKCEYPDASFPMKLLDYAACGRPILCCAQGYLSELVSSSKAGISVASNDHNGLRRAALLLKENKTLRKRMGDNARELALRFFSYDAFQKEITYLFAKMGC